MKVLFLSKRHPQQRDLVERPYGRFHYLPMELSRLGHQIHLALVGHKGGSAGPASSRDGSLERSTRDLRSLGIRGTLDELEVTARKFGPDWIVGCSDAWVGFLAAILARRLRVRLALDAYDDYESYMPWNLPLRLAWRRSLARADLITAAGPQLAQRMARHAGGRPAHVIPMAADPGFAPRDRDSSRANLGLPASVPLLGYSGGWGRKRGTDVLVEAFRNVRAVRPEARLVLSGRPPDKVLDEPGVIALGYLDDDKLPVLLNSLDVACVITARTGFGRYSYPAKLCEAMACGIAVVGTSTEPVHWMLGGRERFLANVGDAAGIANRILENLDSGKVDHGPLPSWKEGASSLAELLLA